MNNLSNERLKALASGDAWTCIQDDEGKSMARELLALREAGKEPVASMHRLVNKIDGYEHPWVCSLGTIQPSEGDIFRVEVIPLCAASPR